MTCPCHACEEKQPGSADVLPGRASAIQATRGDGIGRLGDASSKQLWQGAQHSRRACSSRRKTRQQGWSESFELFHFSEHVFQKLWSERAVYRCATCDGAYTLPKWQREPTTGFAMLASDEGDPFAQEDPLDDSEEVNDSKRKPTHPEGIVRRAPREPFGAGKSRGTQWLQKISHCKASFSVACAKFGAYQRSDSRQNPAQASSIPELTNCMVPTRKMEWFSDTLVLSRVLLAVASSSFFLVLHTEWTAHIHATRFVHMS